MKSILSAIARSINDEAIPRIIKRLLPPTSRGRKDTEANVGETLVVSRNFLLAHNLG